MIRPVAKFHGLFDDKDNQISLTDVAVRSIEARGQVILDDLSRYITRLASNVGGPPAVTASLYTKSLPLLNEAVYMAMVWACGKWLPEGEEGPFAIKAGLAFDGEIDDEQMGILNEWKREVERTEAMISDRIVDSRFVH